MYVCMFVCIYIIVYIFVFISLKEGIRYKTARIDRLGENEFIVHGIYNESLKMTLKIRVQSKLVNKYKDLTVLLNIHVKYSRFVHTRYTCVSKVL